MTVLYSLAKLIGARTFSLVIDSETKQPIGGVTISLIDSKYKTLKETKTSDEFGRVMIHAKAGSYYLKAQKPGYVFGEEVTETDSDTRNREFLNMIKMRALYHNEIITFHKPDLVKVLIQGKRSAEMAPSAPEPKSGELKLPD